VEEVAAPLSPETFVDRINVPVFLAGAWQDQETGSHFAKRDAQGRFKELDEVARSLAADRLHAKAAVKSGHGDKGDRRK